jgi:hypothetical protein
MKSIKTLIFLFCLLFTSHAFGKSNEYYQKTLVHILTECNSKCQKQVFEQEVQIAMFHLLDAVLNQIRFELSQKQKELYD